MLHTCPCRIGSCTELISHLFLHTQFALQASRVLSSVLRLVNLRQEPPDTIFGVVFKFVLAHLRLAHVNLTSSATTLLVHHLRPANDVDLPQGSKPPAAPTPRRYTGHTAHSNLGASSRLLYAQIYAPSSIAVAVMNRDRPHSRTCPARHNLVCGGAPHARRL
ncbi:hypothetical protein CC86DRAFT_153259 [Ophiobolus disseminans]|uniref:Uncharacterized protein n=1 Tax=Ophiobolus disseminans TaxID=1469910 RepID=A0A6A6ZCL5_9PLEO|nr:hypothetical protein CC86DRAFT_153259 [Ophiobolus disseminans]